MKLAQAGRGLLRGAYAPPQAADLPLTGDIVALFDTEEKFFWCIGPMGTLKLMPMGRTLDNGCLFRVTRLEESSLRLARDGWGGSPTAGFVLQSVVTGKYVQRNIRDRLHCDASKVTPNTWMSAARVDHLAPVPQLDGTQKVENLRPVRLWVHKAKGSGAWVQTYESSIHTHLRFNCTGDYMETAKATLYEMPIIRKAAAEEAALPAPGAGTVDGTLAES